MTFPKCYQKSTGKQKYKCKVFLPDVEDVSIGIHFLHSLYTQLSIGICLRMERVGLLVYLS